MCILILNFKRKLFLILNIFSTLSILISSCPSGDITIPGTSADASYQRCGSITSVTIPAAITSMGIIPFLFVFCTSLSKASLITGLTIMSSYMFEGTILSSITIPSTITTMGQLPFALCLTLTYINLVSGLSIIGREFLYSFDPFNYFSMMITMITVPSTITRFENNAFSCDSLRFVQLTSGLRIIGAFVFDMDGLDSALTTITIPSTINSIGMYAFANNANLLCVYWIGAVIINPTTIFLNSPNSISCKMTSSPSLSPSLNPTKNPSYPPTFRPSFSPTYTPTYYPTISTTYSPIFSPTCIPTLSSTFSPTLKPSFRSTNSPSSQPSRQPIDKPFAMPTSSPRLQPSLQPSEQPMDQPMNSPSRQPSTKPSLSPSSQPSSQPIHSPSIKPTSNPKSKPSDQPLQQPTNQPSLSPTKQPTSKPSLLPSVQPSQPSQQPSRQPQSKPSQYPSSQPSNPTSTPRMKPSNQPTTLPTRQPSWHPIYSHSDTPTSSLISKPSNKSSKQPTFQPLNQPSTKPSQQLDNPPTQPFVNPSKFPSFNPRVNLSHKPFNKSVFPSMLPTQYSSPSLVPSQNFNISSSQNSNNNKYKRTVTIIIAGVLLFVSLIVILILYLYHNRLKAPKVEPVNLILIDKTNILIDNQFFIDVHQEYFFDYISDNIRVLYNTSIENIQEALVISEVKSKVDGSKNDKFLNTIPIEGIENIENEKDDFRSFIVLENLIISEGSKNDKESITFGYHKECRLERLKEYKNSNITKNENYKQIDLMISNICLMDENSITRFLFYENQIISEGSKNDKESNTIGYNEKLRVERCKEYKTSNTIENGNDKTNVVISNFCLMDENLITRILLYENQLKNEGSKNDKESNTLEKVVILLCHENKFQSLIPEEKNKVEGSKNDKSSNTTIKRDIPKQDIESKNMLIILTKRSEGSMIDKDSNTIMGGNNFRLVWETPDSISYGTTLSDEHLKAFIFHDFKTISGSFNYIPGKGSMLNIGVHKLSVTFIPKNSHYHTLSHFVFINVMKCEPLLVWNPSDLTYGTPIGCNQLCAQVKDIRISGTFLYSHKTGSILKAGRTTLKVIFFPDSPTIYKSVEMTKEIIINKYSPSLSWSVPDQMTIEQLLSSVHQNAVCIENILGQFKYSHYGGKLLKQKLRVIFIPNDKNNYEEVEKTVYTMVISQEGPEIVWNKPNDIEYEDALSDQQLNAYLKNDKYAGKFHYDPPVGAKLEIGRHNLSVTFKPNDVLRGKSTVTVEIQVTKIKPSITWNLPTFITYPNPLTEKELCAKSWSKSTIPGRYIYDPPLGAVLEVGKHTLSVFVEPEDQSIFQTAFVTKIIVVKLPRPVSVTKRVITEDQTDIYPRERAFTLHPFGHPLYDNGFS